MYIDKKQIVRIVPIVITVIGLSILIGVMFVPHTDPYDQLISLFGCGIIAPLLHGVIELLQKRRSKLVIIDGIIAALNFVFLVKMQNIADALGIVDGYVTYQHSPLLIITGICILLNSLYIFQIWIVQCHKDKTSQQEYIGKMIRNLPLYITIIGFIILHPNLGFADNYIRYLFSLFFCGVIAPMIHLGIEVVQKRRGQGILIDGVLILFSLGIIFFRKQIGQDILHMPLDVYYKGIGLWLSIFAIGIGSLYTFILWIRQMSSERNMNK